MAKKILLFLEQRSGEIKKASLETINFANLISSNSETEIEAVVLGGELDSSISSGLNGVQKLTHLKNSELENYSSSGYADALVNFINECGAKITVFSDTAMGRDLAPRVAAKLNAGLAVDVTEVKTDGEQLIFTRPVYGGKALIDFKVLSDISIVTIRTNIFKSEDDAAGQAELEVKEVGDVNLSSRTAEIKKLAEKLDVAEADIIVSGGRGLQNPENFKLIEDLADILGAAQGASRAVVDAGWRPHSEQVGQTGKTVSPNLYIAVGISGAIQHLAGMRSSKYIVAINKDQDAPIFQVADYGIAGDALEILPVLIEELKKVKAS
jgi:electron transfer flavoprotein alpha subunit